MINMDEENIKKNEKLIEDISNLNKIRQHKIEDDIDELLKGLEF